MKTQPPTKEEDLMIECQAWTIRPGDMMRLPDGRIREVISLRLVVTIDEGPELERFAYKPTTIVEVDRPASEATCRGYKPTDRP